jgi:hypothetical protein
MCVVMKFGPAGCATVGPFTDRAVADREAERQTSTTAQVAGIVLPLLARAERETAACAAYDGPAHRVDSDGSP